MYIMSKEVHFYRKVIHTMAHNPKIAVSSKGQDHSYVCSYVCDLLPPPRPEATKEVSQPEVQVWRGQRWLLGKNEDEVLFAVHAAHTRRLSSVHL